MEIQNKGHQGIRVLACCHSIQAGHGRRRDAFTFESLFSEGQGDVASGAKVSDVFHGPSQGLWHPLVLLARSAPSLAKPYDHVVGRLKQTAA